ncbi:MAG TPA: methyltransferase domain-containing protein [Pseudonocardiaceae bacterium]|nr:methyltransferase domain-containing protein [Pseudonocardiaceae bacterium]
MSTELDGVRDVWERLGADDPYWAVLTEDAFHGGNGRAEFFEIGRREVRDALAVLDRHGRPRGEVAVDFGCGVGRLTYALGEHFDRVVGVDVAASMIDEANAHNPVPERVRFVHNTSTALPFADNSVDLVLSVITMQHMPPSLSLRYLLDMVRITRPGGHLMFQLPSHLPRPTPISRSWCRASVTVLTGPGELVAGSAAQLRLLVRNDGSGTWPPDQLLNAANHWFRDGEPVRWDDGRVAVPGPLAPGESVELALRITAPERPGRYEVEVDLVQETVAWWAQLGSPTVRHPVTVLPGVVPVPVGAPAVTMEMHGVHRDLVCSLFDHLGCSVLEVMPDNRAGGAWRSCFYVVEVGEYRFAPS